MSIQVGDRVHRLGFPERVGKVDYLGTFGLTATTSWRGGAQTIEPLEGLVKVESEYPPYPPLPKPPSSFFHKTVESEGANRVTPRAGLLREAEQIIHGDRNTHYGTPMENFERIAVIWNELLPNKLETGLTAGDVARMMIGLKLARQVTSPSKKDHWLDIAGYAACGFETTEEKN